MYWYYTLNAQLFEQSFVMQTTASTWERVVSHTSKKRARYLIMFYPHTHWWCARFTRFIHCGVMSHSVRFTFLSGFVGISYIIEFVLCAIYFDNGQRFWLLALTFSDCYMHSTFVIQIPFLAHHVHCQILWHTIWRADVRDSLDVVSEKVNLALCDILRHHEHQLLVVFHLPFVCMHSWISICISL